MTPTSAFEWAAASVGTGALVVEATGMRAGGSPWLLVIDHRGRRVEAVLRCGSGQDAADIATEAAALTVAEAHHLAAPRVLAVDATGAGAGAPALLSTKLPGTSTIPLAASRERMQALGAAVAAIHRVPLEPREALPIRRRHMPWVDFAALRRSGESPTSELLAEADERLAAVAPPADDCVLVHGDLWQGNTLWSSDTAYAGTVDWDAAGCGTHGVDLGSLRLDVVLAFDLAAADEVLAGWERAAGRSAGDFAYWDVVAALNTPADLSPSAPSMAQAGRSDLTGELLNARRDELLCDALARLG